MCLYQKHVTQSRVGTVRRRAWGTTGLRKGLGWSRDPRGDCTTRGDSHGAVWRAGTSESGKTARTCKRTGTHIERKKRMQNTQDRSVWIGRKDKWLAINLHLPKKTPQSKQVFRFRDSLWLQSSLTPSTCFTCHTDSRQKEKYELSVTLKLGRYQSFNFLAAAKQTRNTFQLLPPLNQRASQRSTTFLFLRNAVK